MFASRLFANVTNPTIAFPSQRIFFLFSCDFLIVCGTLYDLNMFLCTYGINHPQQGLINAQEQRIFWFALVCFPLIWCLLFMVGLFGFKFKWLVCCRRQIYLPKTTEIFFFIHILNGFFIPNFVYCVKFIENHQNESNRF